MLSKAIADMHLLEVVKQRSRSQQTLGHHKPSSKFGMLKASLAVAGVVANPTLNKHHKSGNQPEPENLESRVAAMIALYTELRTQVCCYYF